MVLLYYEIGAYTVSESLMSLFVSCNDIVADIAERINFAVHGKLVTESSEFHLTLSRAYKAHFFQLEIRKKKRNILSEKRESGIALKSVSLRPKAVLLTPMNTTMNFLFY